MSDKMIRYRFQEGSDDVPQDKDKEQEVKDSVIGIVIKVAVSCVTGILFGFASEKCRVFEPASIRYQMVFERWIMLKMFLAAVATGQVCLSVLSVISFTKKVFQQAEAEFVTTMTEKGILTSAVGPFILGIGMTLAGSCPGMVLPQVGAWSPNAIFTLIGALTGALIYGLLAEYIQNITRPKESFKTFQIHETLKIPFIAIALPMAVILSIVVVLLEVYIPYTQELEKPDLQHDNIFSTRAWPPFVGGIMIGLIQIPIVLVLGNTIGGSTSYVTIVSQWVRTSRLEKMFPYLAKRHSGIGNWWQVVYVCGAILGGFISSWLSNSFSDVQGVGLIEALFGGFLLIFGARLASGCTSGHGLSGMGILVWLSFVAVPFMFAGAISTAYIMRASGTALDHFVTSTLQL